MELTLNAWDIISPIFLWLLGLFFCNALGDRLNLSRRRILIVYLWHTFWCMIYLVYTLTRGGDSLMYFSRALTGESTFGIGTSGVIYFTSILTNTLYLSYLGCFLVYNIIGSIGLIIFDSIIIFQSQFLSKVPKRVASFIIFMPSISFWSSAIGKDGVAFTSVVIAVWACISLKKRILYAFLSILIMVCVRPHVACFLLLGLMVSLLFKKNLSIYFKLFLLGFCIYISAYLIPFTLNLTRFGEIDSSSIDSVIDYIERRQVVTEIGNLQFDPSSTPLPILILSYLLRPSLFEVTSLFGLLAAIDNMILTLLFILVGLYFLKGKRLILPVGGNAVFPVLYSLSATIVFSLTTSNLGIALRQKWMLLPMIIYIFLSYLYQKRKILYYRNLQLEWEGK